MTNNIIHKKYVVKNRLNGEHLPLSIPLKMAKAFKKPSSATLCPKCLALFIDAQGAKIHAANCHPQFLHKSPLTPNLSVAIVTPDSPPTERRICERLAKISYFESGWDCPVLRRRKWINRGWHYHAYLLTAGEKVAGYIVIGQVNSIEQDEFGLWSKDIVADMFIVAAYRRQGYMRHLLKHALKAMRHTLETVWFQDPSEEGEKFLDKMSEETDLDYRIC